MQRSKDKIRKFGMSHKVSYELLRVKKGDRIIEGRGLFLCPKNGYAVRVDGNANYMCVLSPADKFEVDIAWRKLNNNNPLGTLNKKNRRYNNQTDKRFNFNNEDLIIN